MAAEGCNWVGQASIYSVIGRPLNDSKGGFEMTMRGQTIRVTVMCLMISTIALASCSGESAEVELVQPFTVRVLGYPTSTMEFSGNTRGHRPGEESTFVLTLQNDSGTVWEWWYCVELLSRESVVAELARQEFVLQDGESRTEELEIYFPEYLEADAYGLAIVVPERFGSTKTIYVGEGVDEVEGASWADPRCR